MRGRRLNLAEAALLLGTDQDEAQSLLGRHRIVCHEGRLWRSVSPGYPPVYCTHVIEGGYEASAVEELRRYREALAR